jgi:K+-sensing histidine kinase KdpD
MFERARRRRDRIAVICAVLVPPAVCAVLVPARTSLPNTDGALVLVVVTVAVAGFGNRVAGYLAALGSALWFDFFLTMPYERLDVTHRIDIQTTVLLLLVGVVVTELAVAARRRGRAAMVTDTLLTAIQSTAGLVARGEGAETIVSQVCVQFCALLGARCCAFESAPVRVRGLRFEPDGSLHWGAAVWDLDEHGFPDEKIDFPALYSGEVYGRFTLTPVPGTAPSARARCTAVVLAELAAAAVAAERARHDV